MNGLSKKRESVLCMVVIQGCVLDALQIATIFRCALSSPGPGPSWHDGRVLEVPRRFSIKPWIVRIVPLSESLEQNRPVQYQTHSAAMPY